MRIYCNNCGFSGYSENENCPECKSAVTVKVRE